MSRPRAAGPCARWAVGVLVFAAGWSCSSPARAPSIERFEPVEGPRDGDVAVRIFGSGFTVGTRYHFDTETTAIDATFRVVVVSEGGDQIGLADVAWLSPTELAATVPAGVPRGSYAALAIGPRGGGPRADGVYEATGACADVDGDAICDVSDSCIDQDGDGFGSSPAASSGCADPRVDCDDDPARCGAGCYPGNPATDLLDGSDEDCDGTDGEDRDVTPPVILVLGPNPTTVPLLGVYVDAGASALDDVDGDVTANIIVSNPVDTAVAGTYTVTYDVQDAAGNPARATRIVHAVDTKPPTLTLQGESPLYVYHNGVFADPGATAFDDNDGDISGDVVVTGTVDPASLGTVTLEYDVQDAAGNPAATVTRTVRVIFDCLNSQVASRPLDMNYQTLDLGSVYVVCSLTQLEEVRVDVTDTSLDAGYLLGIDIDASVTAAGTYEGGSGWQPIGDCGTGTCSDGDEVPFTGVFYGGGRVIDQLTISRDTQHGVGLFGHVLGGVIVGVGLAGANVIGAERVGTVAGNLAGGSALASCWAEGSVLSTLTRAGGLVGYSTGGSLITRSSADVAVDGSRAGGLVGTHASATISDSYALGDVTGVDIAGGLIGLDINGQTYRSYAAGDVAAEESVGGLVGQTSGAGSIITAAFCIGSVSGDTPNHEYVGAVIGKTFGHTTTAVYYDGTATIVNTGGAALTPGIGIAIDVGGTAAPDFFFASTSPPMTQWDFTNVWIEQPGQTPALR